jgi:UDP-GlcNAc3NAcA epimerase
MKVLTVVGARPQFIKAAPVSRELRQVATEVLVHTGQHFDANMSDVFFEELGIPKPDYHLGIGGGSHGAMTGAMLASLEAVIQQEKPDWVMVYGDTNSTLAGGLAAAKLHVPVAHVEAGLRSFNRQMPEEINRVLTDHLSTMLFAPTETAVRHLASEGITRGVHQTGDVMLDATRLFLDRAEANRSRFDTLGLDAGSYVLATVHRAENTDDPVRLREILGAFGALAEPIVMPLHPRTRKQLDAFGLDLPGNVRAIDPVGYLDMLLLESRAKVILTDSGGVQKEACFLEVPCVTLRDETEWTETVEAGWNTLTGADAERILRALSVVRRPDRPLAAFGDGQASQRIASILAHVNAS